MIIFSKAHLYLGYRSPTRALPQILKSCPELLIRSKLRGKTCGEQKWGGSKAIRQPCTSSGQLKLSWVFHIESRLTAGFRGTARGEGEVGRSQGEQRQAVPERRGSHLSVAARQGAGEAVSRRAGSALPLCICASGLVGSLPAFPSGAAQPPFWPKSSLPF